MFESDTEKFMFSLTTFLPMNATLRMLFKKINIGYSCIFYKKKIKKNKYELKQHVINNNAARRIALLK